MTSMRGRQWVAGLLMASLLPLSAGPAQAVAIPPLPLPAITIPPLIPTSVPLPPLVPGVTPTEVPLQPAPPVPQPSPAPTRPGTNPQAPVTSGPTADPQEGAEGVVEVPGPVETVFVPTPVPTLVPGPTVTVFRDKLSPQQERVVEKRIQAERIKFGAAGVLAGFLVAFTAAALIAYRFFRKGEIAGLRILRDTL